MPHPTTDVKKKADTLAELCEELCATNWFDQPPYIPSSRGMFRLTRGTDPYLYCRTCEISDLQFKVSGEIGLGQVRLRVDFVSPGHVGPPPWWAPSHLPGSPRLPVYSMSFSEIERALTAIDWVTRPPVVSLNGIDWACHYSREKGRVRLDTHIEDGLVTGSVSLFYASTAIE